MHRLILATLLVISGCVVPTRIARPASDRTTSIQISKARNAISETRAAIAEARGAPHLEELYVRLGELMSDEAKYHYQVAYEREQRAGKALNVPQVKFLKEQTVLVYELVLRRYQRVSSQTEFFSIWAELREIGNYKDARESRTARSRLQTPTRPDALLVLGDDQFGRKQNGRSSGLLQANRRRSQRTHDRLRSFQARLGLCQPGRVQTCACEL